MKGYTARLSGGPYAGESVPAPVDRVTSVLKTYLTVARRTVAGSEALYRLSTFDSATRVAEYRYWPEPTP